MRELTISEKILVSNTLDRLVRSNDEGDQLLARIFEDMGFGEVTKDSLLALVDKVKQLENELSIAYGQIEDLEDELGSAETYIADLEHERASHVCYEEDEE